MFGDAEVVNKTRSAPYQDALMAVLRELESEITPLRIVVDDKDKIVNELQNRVGIFVTSAYATEQNDNEIHIQETKHTSRVRPFTYLIVQWSNSFLSKGSMV